MKSRIAKMTPLACSALVILLAFGLIVLLSDNAEAQEQSPSENSGIATDWAGILDQLGIWGKKFAAARDRIGLLRLERETTTPAEGTRLPVDQEVINWHFQTLRLAIQSTSPESWAVVNECLHNLLTIVVPAKQAEMALLARSILDKELPADCSRWVHISAMKRALSPLITSDNPEDRMLVLKAETPGFWGPRLKGKRCEIYPEREFPGRPSDDSYILLMRLEMVRAMVSIDQSLAIECAQLILARKDEDPDYVKKIQREYAYAQEILTSDVDPRLKYWQ